MSGQLPMFPLTTCEGTDNATGSAALEFGLTPCGSPDGPTTGSAGLDLVPVSHSQTPERRKRSTIRGIYGQSGLFSSGHDDLSWFLASRLRQRTDSLGSTLFTLTWVTRVTPAGLSISALRASEPLTGGSGYSSWRTPTAGCKDKGGAQDSEKRLAGGHTLDLQDEVRLASWPTATVNDARNGRNRTAGRSDPNSAHHDGVTLCDAATLAGWPTPSAIGDTSGGGSVKEAMRRENGQSRASGAPIGSLLRHTAMLAMNPDGPARLTATGEMLTGSGAGTGSGGQLNPAFPRWLMGLPPVWDLSAIAAARSLRKRKRG